MNVRQSIHLKLLIRHYTLLAILTSYIYIYILYIIYFIVYVSYIYFKSYIYRILRIFSHYASCKLTSVLNYSLPYCTLVHSHTGARKAVSEVLRATDAHTMRAHKHNGWQRLSDN